MNASHRTIEKLKYTISPPFAVDFDASSSSFVFFLENFNLSVAAIQHDPFGIVEPIFSATLSAMVEHLILHEAIGAENLSLQKGRNIG